MDRRRADAFHVLGIPVDSDADEVVRAYRRLARATHPDVSADPEAADRFATLGAAYRLAYQAASVADCLASADGAGQRHEGSAYGRDSGDGGPASDRTLWWGSKAGWSMPLGASPRRGRLRQVAPIVAGPVFISPSRGTGPGEVRGG
jgi:hypothetical protein